MRPVGHQTIKAAETLGIEIPLEAAINFAVSEKLLDIAEITFEELLEIVSEVTIISKEAILGASQKDAVVRARYLLCRKTYDYIPNKAFIARKLNRDHSTIISGLKRIDGEIDANKSNPLSIVTYWNEQIEEKIKDLMVEKIIFAALEEERRMSDAS